MCYYRNYFLVLCGILTYLFSLPPPNRKTFNYSSLRIKAVVLQKFPAIRVGHLFMETYYRASFVLTSLQTIVFCL